ncbi:hypothetical protein ACVWYH_007841 [Bradyrhizobium sp. GM24.11]
MPIGLPGGFPRPLAARERKWKTPNGKANFTVPKSAFAPPKASDGVYELMTMRADGQFNTTIYTEDDRFRGIEGSRYVVLMNPADMEADGLKFGDTVTSVTEANDGVERSLSELQVVPYDIPCWSIAGYYPECFAVIALRDIAKQAQHLAMPQGNEPVASLHLHAVLGLQDGTLRGGHLLSGSVQPTLEVTITETVIHLRRKKRPDLGIALISI